MPTQKRYAYTTEIGNGKRMFYRHRCEGMCGQVYVCWPCPHHKQGKTVQQRRICPQCRAKENR